MYNKMFSDICLVEFQCIIRPHTEVCKNFAGRLRSRILPLIRRSIVFFLFSEGLYYTCMCVCVCVGPTGKDVNHSVGAITPYYHYMDSVVFSSA
jgi:hypothetical protein